MSNENIDIMFNYIQTLFVRPKDAKLDLNALDKEYLKLGKATLYLGESFIQFIVYVENITEGKLLYEPQIKNDMVYPAKVLQDKLSELMNEMYRIADGDYDRKFEFMGDLSDAFADMVEGLKGKEKLTIEKEKTEIQIDKEEYKNNTSQMIEEGLFQQIAHYERLVELSGEMRRFRHDFRNHLLALDSLLADSQIDKARDYIMSITPIVYTSDLVLNTDNYIFDALLSEKIKLARSKDIKVNVRIGISRKLDVDNVDWCILVGNAMDNAIEACEKIKTGRKFINITITHKGNIVSTKIENSTEEVPIPHGDFFKTTKGDSVNHGMGLKSIAHTVEKYDGVLDTSYKDGVFTLFFMLSQI